METKEVPKKNRKYCLLEVQKSFNLNIPYIPVIKKGMLTTLKTNNAIAGSSS